MKIIFLGTGPSSGIPRKGCRCAVCKEAIRPASRTRRRRSSILIQQNGKNILIDAGPDFLEQVKRAKIKKMDAVFFTHEHHDAMGGFKKVIKWLENKQQKVSLYLPKIKNLKLKIKNYNLKLKNIPPFQSIQVGQIKIIPFPVNHGLKSVPTFGFNINNKVVYASDMDSVRKKSLKYFRAPILILDAALWPPKKMKGHLNYKQTLQFANQFNPQKVYLTQIGHGYPPHQESIKAIKQESGKTKKQFKIMLTYDGMKIKI